MGKDKKRPVIGQGLAPAGGKQARVAPDAIPSPNQCLPVWRFSTMDLDGPWGWRAITKDDWWIIHTRLCSLETMTWQNILTTGSHPIEKHRIIPDAQKRLEELNKEDVDELYSLRMTGRERLWGIRDREIFQALWWDPAHEICPSVKKHT